MTVWFAAALVVAVPLAFDPGGYFTFLPLKWTLGTVLVWLGIACVLIERRSVAPRPLRAAWAALVGVLVLSSILGTGGPTSWIGYPGRSLGVIAWVVFFGAFLLGSSIPPAARRVHVVRAASVACVLVSLYALAQAAGIDPIVWSENVDVSRTRSTLGNAAFLGAYLAMIVPVSARIALMGSQDVRWRTVHTLAAMSGVAALLTTQTRGAWLGAIVGGMAMLALESERVMARPARTAAFAGTALLALVLLATVSPLGPRIRSIADPATGTGRGRTLQWGRTVELVADRPVLGWGPETYASTFPKYIDARFEKTVRRDVVPDRAHNVFLDLAAASGLLGVAAWIALLGLVGVILVRKLHRDALTVGLAGGCAAYLVQLQFSFPLADLDTVFWLFAGMAVGPTLARSTRVSRLWVVPSLVAAALFGVWGGADVVADRSLRDALRAEARGDLDGARLAVDRAARVGFGRAQYLQAAARLHRRTGEASAHGADFMKGIKQVSRARQTVPNDVELAMDYADLFVSWGQTASDEGLIARGAEAYEEILERDPNSSRVHLKLGVAYVELGRESDAEREWRTAASLAPQSAAPWLNLGLLYEEQAKRRHAREALRRAFAREPDNDLARDALKRLDE